jgi:hypothetical protein
MQRERKKGKEERKKNKENFQECRSRVSRQEIKGAKKRNHFLFQKFPPTT